MATDQSRLEGVQAAVAASLHLHWRAFLIEGIVLLILGLFAIVIPNVATLAVEVFIGWVLLLSGVVGLISTFRMRSAPGFGWSLLSAVIAIAAGVILLAWPLSGVLSPHFDSDCVSDPRGRRLDHDGVDSPARFLRTLGALAGERSGRPDPGGDDYPRSPGNRGLGHRPPGRHQHGVRRLGADLDGAAGPIARAPRAGCIGRRSLIELTACLPLREQPALEIAEPRGARAAAVPAQPRSTSCRPQSRARARPPAARSRDRPPRTDDGRARSLRRSPRARARRWSCRPPAGPLFALAELECLAHLRAVVLVSHDGNEMTAAATRPRSPLDRACSSSSALQTATMRWLQRNSER